MAKDHGIRLHNQNAPKSSIQIGLIRALEYSGVKTNSGNLVKHVANIDQRGNNNYNDPLCYFISKGGRYRRGGVKKRPLGVIPLLKSPYSKMTHTFR